MSSDVHDANGEAKPAGGLFADLSGNDRIPILMDLVNSLTAADEPAAVLNDFIAAMRRLDGPRSYMSLQTGGLPPGEFRIARWLSPKGRELVEPFHPWPTDALPPIRRGGFLSEVVATPTPKLAHRLRLSDDPFLGRDAASLGSMVAVPYLRLGEPTSWTLLFHPEPEAFTSKDLEAAILRTTLIGATASTVLANHHLHAAVDWIHSEIDQIAQIQRSLLPQEEPDVPGLSFAAHYATFDRAGGDYYDLLPLRHLPGELPFSRYTEDLASPWVILIADASGHGPSAAVVVAMLHAILHGYQPETDEPPGPAAMLEHLSRRLFARRIGVGASFVTAFLGIYDPVSRTLTYANAGHHPPLLRTPHAGREPEVTQLRSTSGTPMGVRDFVGAEERTITLTSGQTLLLYTDGVVEAANPERDHYGLEGLSLALARGPEAPAELVRHIAAALTEHESTSRPRDDQTLVALRVI